MITKLREYYNKGITLSYDFRIQVLEELESSILSHYEELIESFKKDYNKCEFDVLNTEIALVLQEIRYFKNNLYKLMAPRRVHTSLINFPSKGYIVNEPYGVVFIASPWNYPFQLAFMPLVGAIAGGNVVCLKVSDQTTNVREVIRKILSVFPDDYIYLVSSSNEERENLFDCNFDYIFYTGSNKVARELMARQAKYLTPMTLELGGKSPCIVDEDADIQVSSKRITWGKFLNAGQTCVAPDYILVHESIKNDFVTQVIKNIKTNYYTEGMLNEEYTHIINVNHLNRLKKLLEDEKILFGGTIVNNTLEPTVVDDIKYSSKLMQEEIFGPIMPIVTYRNLDEVLEKIANLEKPLAVYCFTKNREKAKKIMNSISYGGGCINDVVMHVSEENLPFGGIKSSGMNSYHGKKSYEVFTHNKSILVKHPRIELNLKYPPYNSKKLAFSKKYFKINK